MSGPIALHGGGEFLPGDEPFLETIMQAARRFAADGPVRAVVVPVAAGRHRPALAGSQGVAALDRVAAAGGIELEARSVLVVDGETARDPALVEQLAAAHLIHLPGGDPDLVPGILAGTDAWRAITDANEAGSVLAGASAGAMGLADVTWTPGGFRDGLGLVEGFVVIPHFEQFDVSDRAADVAEAQARGLSAVGLDERTAVLRDPGGGWTVIGAGRAVWLPSEGPRVTARHGEPLPIPG